MNRTLPPMISPATLSGRAPGVYRQDIFPAPEPTFLTGIPVFLGRAEKGPVNVPLRLTLWPQFTEGFGAPLAVGALARAVRGFFKNDGLMCYVLRLDEDIHSPLNRLRTGLDAVSAMDGIDLVCVPDVVAPYAEASPDLDAVVALQAEVLNHCHRLGDRFAILDGVLSADTAVIEKQRRGLNGDYGALYFPWLWVAGEGGQPAEYAPPCGHVAGVYSRSDQQVGVHKAPANEVVQGVLDLRLNVTDAEQGGLNKQGVNCLRAFPGRGIRIWGARTLSDDPTWTYVNVRRLFVTIGRWLERYMTEVTFSANNVGLWVRIMRELTAYLEDLFRQGALKGRTLDQAFFVKCDGETNPPEVRDAGMVVAEIGLAAVTPGEFIVVRVIHGASGVDVVQV